MKRITILFTVLTVILSLLSGCTGNALPTQPLETVENIFSAPITEHTGPPTSGGEDTTSPDMNITEPPMENLGTLSMGFDDRSQLNEMGPYLVYEGGEMHIGFHFNIMGSIGNDGVGLMLILDGKPQPYRTAENEEYGYLHTFYPPTKSGGKISIELIFTPVTGVSGDNLVLQAFQLIEPDYDPAGENKGFRVTNGSTCTDTQVIFNTDPPVCDRPDITERVVDLSVQQTDLTSSDISGWSAKELQTEYSFKHQIDSSESNNMIFNISRESKLQYHAEIFSPSIVEWSLILYIDNQPVSVLPRNEIHFHTPNGKKAVIDITLDMAGYEEGSPFYAVLVVRNTRDPLVWEGTTCHTEITATRFITCEENLAAWQEKYHPDSPNSED